MLSLMPDRPANQLKESNDALQAADEERFDAGQIQEGQDGLLATRRAAHVGPCVGCDAASAFACPYSPWVE